MEKLKITLKEHYDRLREVNPDLRNEFDAELSLYGMIDYFRGTMCRKEDYNLRKTPAAIMLVMKKFMPFSDTNFLENAMPPILQSQALLQS